MEERRIVVPDVAGSIPAFHPSRESGFHCGLTQLVNVPVSETGNRWFDSSIRSHELVSNSYRFLYRGSSVGLSGGLISRRARVRLPPLVASTCMPPRGARGQRDSPANTKILSYSHKATESLCSAAFSIFLQHSVFPKFHIFSCQIKARTSDTHP